MVESCVVVGVLIDGKKEVDFLGIDFQMKKKIS